MEFSGLNHQNQSFILLVNVKMATEDIETRGIIKAGNHNANTPMQNTAIFHGCKNVNFQMKKYNIFLIFAQNIDCGYTLEPPH